MFGALKNPCEIVDLGGFRRPEASLRLQCFWSVRIAVAFSSERHQVLPPVSAVGIGVSSSPRPVPVTAAGGVTGGERGVVR
jgi:hypothetical protein